MAGNTNKIIPLFGKLQRDITRLPDLYTSLMTLHMQRYPDMRFGQLICNILAQGGYKSIDTLFYIEDDVMQKLIEQYCDADSSVKH